MYTPATRRYCAALGLLLLTVLVSACAAGRREPRELEILSDGYPAAFFFRHSAGAATQKPYEKWEKSFSRLMGVEGKVLSEELWKARRPRTRRYFTRFKKQHPRQMVLMHFNGNARDPRFRRDDFFAGHWLYHNGATITQDVPKKNGETVIHVSDATLFRLDKGRYGKADDDIGLCRLDSNGEPNWHVCEQVKLLDIDRKAKTIRVRRGMYGTEPRAWKAGESYAAAHCTEGPWGRNNHLLWYYNYSTVCPEDKQGRVCRDVLVDQIAGWFAQDGELARFDGVEFDVLHNYAGGGRGRGPDCNADGKPDRGRLNGRNVYGIGVVRYLRQLRRAVGDDVLLLADGTTPHMQRGFGLLNGIESEGWPALRDHSARDWSGGLNRHFFWQKRAREPVLNYVNHKYINPGAEGRKRYHPDVPFRIHRLAFSAAVFTDSAICYSYPPKRDPAGMFGIWDELRMGKEHRTGWLGRPEGPARRMALPAPDLLDGKGSPPGRELLRRCETDEAGVALQDGCLKVQGADPDADRISVTLTGLPASEKDLFVSVTARGARREGYPRETARLMHTRLNPGGRLQQGIKTRSGPERELPEDFKASINRRGAVTMGGETHEALFMHPPYEGDMTGYSFWSRMAELPRNASLEFWTGMGSKSPSRSDGVVFRVQVAPVGKDGKPGQFRTVHSSRQKAHEWRHHTVSLEEWAGQTVCIKLISDCGPENDTTTDHSYWGAPTVTGGKEPQNLLKTGGRRQFMTWVDKKSFTSGFYFSSVHPPKVDLTFTIESAEPLWIEDITLHAHPDAMYREFENGVVLANPAPHSYTFALAKMFPGEDFRHLQATKNQDTEANNGRPVGDSITLQGKEGIFLVKN